MPHLDEVFAVLLALKFFAREKGFGFTRSTIQPVILNSDDH